MSIFNRQDRLTTKEAAAYLGVHPSTLEAWRSKKYHVLPYLKIGTLVRYDRDDLDDWLKICKVRCLIKPI